MASYRFEKELYNLGYPELLALPIYGAFFDPQCMENDMFPSSVMGMHMEFEGTETVAKTSSQNCIHNLLLLHLGAKMHFSNLNSLIS